MENQPFRRFYQSVFFWDMDKEERFSPMLNIQLFQLVLIL